MKSTRIRMLVRLGLGFGIALGLLSLLWSGPDRGSPPVSDIAAFEQDGAE